MINDNKLQELWIVFAAASLGREGQRPTQAGTEADAMLEELIGRQTQFKERSRRMIREETSGLSDPPSQ